MFITVAHYKGGAGKTTTAVHLAAFFQKLAPTLFIDGDPNRSATFWASRGKMPFTIVDEAEGAFQARNYKHVVIDTEARPGGADLETLAKGCDLLIIPAAPGTLDSAALNHPPSFSRSPAGIAVRRATPNLSSSLTSAARQHTSARGA